MTRAMTLIELLAVIVIITMAAGVTMTSLATAGDHAAWRQWLNRVQDLDAKARLAARTGEVTRLVADESGYLSVVAGEEQIAIATAPQGTTLRLTTEYGSIDAIAIDARGRSIDYSVVLARGDEAHTLRVCGLTGAVMEDDGGEP